MFDSRIFYLQLGDAHRNRPQVVTVAPRRAPRSSERRIERHGAGR